LSTTSAPAWCAEPCPPPRNRFNAHGEHQMKLGFIGLGIMGAPMAGHLLAAGHELFAQSFGGVPAQLQEQGAKVCANAREVAQQADIVFIMVPDTPHVADVLFGANGAAEGLSAGKTVVDMSSI